MLTFTKLHQVAVIFCSCCWQKPAKATLRSRLGGITVTSMKLAHTATDETKRLKKVMTQGENVTVTDENEQKRLSCDCL